MKRITLAVAVAAGMLGAVSSSASAATRAVDDDAKATPRNCDAQTPASPSIQAAVTASSSGDTIVVCPGTYVEQVTIPAGKNRLTLISAERRQAIIKAPPATTGQYNRLRPDLVRVDGAQDASFISFTITGPLADDHFCNELLVSNVRILAGGSANLLDNRITKAKPTNPALLGCQNGFGVQIGRRFEGDTGSGRLYGNEIDDYNKGGIYVDNVGSELEAAGNIVRGPDLSGGAPGVALAAPNGVQISRGADGDFHHNKVVDNVFPGVKQLPPGVDFIEGLEPGQASGITLFSPSGEDGGLGDVRVHQNLVQNNDVNLGLFNADRTFVQSNSLLDAPFYDGLYADEESEDNRFVANTALRNTEHDCHDDSNGDGTAGTANRWSGNRGETENRPGLCRDRGGHEDDDGHGGGHHRHARWR